MSQKESAKPSVPSKRTPPSMVKEQTGPVTAPEVLNRPDTLATPLAPTFQQQALLNLQRYQGNQYVQRYIQREVNYNVQDDNGSHRDPEEMAGVLEFTDDGWDSIAIGQRVSQINSATPHFDESRCVEASFLVGLIQRGPDAVRGMIENYLARYRQGLRRDSTPENIKRWYRHSIRLLSPMLERIDNQTLTYTDVAVIMQEMYDVYGEGDLGTRWSVGNNMAAREGYTVTVVDTDIFIIDDAATMAQALEPGEMLSCRVEADSGGSGDYDHAIHIGRHPETNQLYLYDPWPVAGDQMIIVSDDLHEVDHYFSNHGTYTNPDGTTEPTEEMRTFNVYARLTPPQDEAAPE